MGFTYSFYHAERHATYKSNDVLKFSGYYYTSADGLQVYGTHDNTSRYFYGYYTSNSSWVVLAPICFSYTTNHAWAFAKLESIVSGGTLDTYTISYNANGGSGAPSSQTKTYGVNLTLRSNIPTRAGYNFAGWSDSPSGSKKWDAGGIFTWNSNTTLYALWSPHKHTVAYNANGGSGAPSSQTKTYGSALTLSSVKPTRTGHSFVGWGTSSSDTSADYNAGSSYTRDQNGGTYTLYAIWKANTYPVEYNANGGSGAPSSQTKTYGVNLNLSSTIPTRQYYKFLGWGTSPASTSPSYSAGATYTGNSGITLYAVWALDSYTISYVLNGGTNNSNNKTTNVIGTTLPLYNPTRIGYTFVGWHMNSQSGNIVTSIPSSNKANVTLYAEWRLNKYKITINPNGGSYKGSTSNTIVNADYLSNVTLETPVKEGNVFRGWNLSGAGKISDNKFTVDLGDATLTAIWDLEVLSVNYDTCGGILGSYNQGYNDSAMHSGGNYCSIKYQYNDDISKYNIPSVTRENFIFLGWYTAKEGGTLVTSPFAVKDNTSLYAHWKMRKSASVYTENTFKSGVAFIKDDTKKTLPKGIVYIYKNGRFVKGGEI